jgi:hypothetical protein
VPRTLFAERPEQWGVTAIDRLGRSVAEVTRTIGELGERGILLRALREGIDTATPTGRAVAAIMATLAELELELGRERRAASRQSRRARQLPATKPAKLSPERQEQLRRLAATGEPIREWKVNFRGGTTARVVRDGKTSVTRGDVIEDPDMIAELRHRMATGHGARKAQRNIGLKFRDAGVPSLKEFRQAVDENKLVAIRFTPA